MNKNILNQSLLSIIIFSFLLTFTNCGSFEGVSYYATDGIYNSERLIKNQQNKIEPSSSTDQSSNYYENYFKNFSIDSQNQANEISNSVNENSDVYIIDNSPNIRMSYGFNSFDYWNNWAFGGFRSPYNRFSYNGFYDPFWGGYGYQSFYYNNFWGNGYSPYSWNNYNSYDYIPSNQNQYGRKVAYNRGASNQRSFNRFSRSLTNNKTRPSSQISTKNTRTNVGRKLRNIINDFSPQNQSYPQSNRVNNRSNYKRNNSRSSTNSTRSSSSNRSSVRSSRSSRSSRSKSGRNN